MIRPNVDYMGSKILTPGLIIAVIAALGCVPRSLDLDPGRQAGDYMATGKAYLDQGMSDSALAAFGMALETNPKLTQAYLSIAAIYRQRNDYDLAERFYDRAADLAPTNFEAHYSLGLMRQLLGRLEEAVVSYLRALAIQPRDLATNLNLASLYMQLNHPESALVYARAATDIERSSQPAWATLGAALNLAGQYAPAIDAFRQAAELGEASEPVALGLAESHIRLEHYDRALAVLQDLLRRHPGAAAHERMGYILFKQRQYLRSLESFQAALGLDARDTAALNGQGVSLMTLYIQSGKSDARQRDLALDAWRQSLQIRPDQPRIIDLLARYSRM